MQDTQAPVSNSTESQPSEPLRYRTARAALTSGAAEVITRVLTIVLSIVTARVLEPKEVGLLGLAVILVGVVSMLGFYPETAAVTVRDEGSHRKYALAATEVRVVVVVVALAVLWLTLPAIGDYLTGKDDGAAPLRELLGVLVWVPVLELVSGYPQVVMQRRLELNYLARIQVLQPVVFVGLAVTLLLTGYGYIGVAFASVTSAAVASVLLWWRLLRAREVIHESWSNSTVRRETWRNTGKVFLGGFGGYIGGRVDNLLVSGSIGPAAMSFYSMAWNASRTPSNVFAKAINFVLVPALARIQDDPSRVQRALRECVRNSYLLLAPACALLFVTAPLLVTYVIGAKWLPLVPALRVMCFTVLAVPILFSAAALLVGTGRSHLTGIATAVHLATLLITIPVLSSRWGVLGAAYADLLAVFLLTLTLALTVRSGSHQMGWAVLKTAALPVGAALTSGVLAWGVSQSIHSDAVRLSVGIGVTLLGYIGSVAVVGGRARLVDLAGLLRNVVRRTPMPVESQI